MPKIKRLSLVDQIYLRLREQIITGQLPLGSRINVNEIQTELGVSSTPLREALNRLQQDGLVCYENNVGASVLTLDAHDVEEIEELALTLQSAAVRFSLARGDRAAMSREAAEQLARYEAARSPAESVEAVFALIGVFYHHCGNRRLDESMIALQGQVLLLRWLYAGDPAGRANADLLRAVCKGIEANDPEAIVSALAEYSRRSRPVLLKQLAPAQGD